MFIDIIVVVLLAMAIFKGLRKGFVLALFSFLAFIIGLAAALKLSAAVASYLSDNTGISQRWLPFIAFAVVFILVAFLVKMGARAIEAVLRIAMLGWLNKMGGILFYALLYLFIFSIFLFYAEKLDLIKPHTIRDSVSYAYLQPLAPRVIEGLSIVLPFFKNMFAQLTGFFEGFTQET